MIIFWAVFALVTFMVTGILWNTRDDFKSGAWFFGSTIFNVAIFFAIFWFGGYASDSPWYPERQSKKVAGEIGACFGRSDYYETKCLKEIRRKYDSCELKVGFTIHEGREPDLSCFETRKSTR